MTRLSDLYDYDEELPRPWADSINEIETAGANRNHVEAEKLKIQIALLTSQMTVALFVEDQADQRAKDDLAAATKRADAADTIAKSLRRATWVLAGATVALVLATVLLFVGGL